MSYYFLETLTILTLMESNCWRKASSASLLGENIRNWRELLGGRVVGTANPSLSPPEDSRERDRFLPPAGKEHPFRFQLDTEQEHCNSLVTRNFMLFQLLPVTGLLM